MLAYLNAYGGRGLGPRSPSFLGQGVRLTLDGQHVAPNLFFPGVRPNP